ncbi:MAG: hypothetical protein OD814_001346 [Candidatus Alkanophagales archaeon MCA70_species_1]|nr:hypothetical protein [Candidatus Alkanophaga volatiphilum]
MEVGESHGDAPHTAPRRNAPQRAAPPCEAAVVHYEK